MLKEPTETGYNHFLHFVNSVVKAISALDGIASSQRASQFVPCKGGVSKCGITGKFQTVFEIAYTLLMVKAV